MPYKSAASLSDTDLTYLNRLTASALSAFDYPSGDLGFVLLHEQVHLDKLARMTPLTRRAVLKAYQRNERFFLKVEAETDQAACVQLKLGGRELVLFSCR